MSKKGVAILGSTGRLGKISLNLLSTLQNDFEVQLLLCNKDWETLLQQIKVFKPRYAILMDENAYNKAKDENPIKNTQILFGLDGIRKACELRNLEIIILSVIGSTGFTILIECIKFNKKILLANKEAIVIGGNILKKILQNTGSQIIPLDSEHCSILRLMENVKSDFIKTIYVTASGGPFLNKSESELYNVTPEEALKHPVWDMGKRITIDSATLMNKAIEIIEAKYLFDIPIEKIKVLIHPESLFHAFIELKDSIMIGLLHKPDMKIPLLFGLYHPNYFEKINDSHHNGFNINWANIESLRFISDINRFKNIKLAYKAAAKGHNYEIALNASDEVAVEHFLNYKIKFTQIIEIIENILSSISFRRIDTVEDAINYDKEIKLKTAQVCKQYY